MLPSGSYVVVESMIRQNSVMMFEVEQLVQSLERRGLLTPSEQKDLIQLAKKVLPKTPANFFQRDTSR